MKMLRVNTSNHDNNIDAAATNFRVVVSSSSSHQERCEIEQQQEEGKGDQAIQITTTTKTKTTTTMVDTPPTKPQRKKTTKNPKTTSNKLSSMSNIKSSFLQKTHQKGDIKERQEEQQQPQEKKQKEKRCVTFYPFVKMREIPHLNDMEDDIIRSTYMSSDDFTNIRSECIDLVHELQDENGDIIIKEGYYLRGLDKRTYKYSVRRDAIHNELQDAVYHIQQVQQFTGKDTSQLLAETCAKITQPSVISAQIAAISDLFTCFHDAWMKRTVPTIETTPTHGKMTLG